MFLHDHDHDYIRDREKPVGIVHSAVFFMNVCVDKIHISGTRNVCVDEQSGSPPLRIFQVIIVTIVIVIVIIINSSIHRFIIIVVTMITIMIIYVTARSPEKLCTLQ